MGARDVIGRRGGQAQEDAISIKELKGKIITLTGDVHEVASVRWPGKVFVNFAYIDENGDEGRAFTSAVAIVSKLKDPEMTFPFEVQVITYSTDKGSDGFDFDNIS